MKRQDFFYHLPDELIARYPAAERSGSRLLCMDRHSGQLQHHHFRDLALMEDGIKPGDLLVFNNTRVIPARLFGHKTSGGKLEILVERLLQDNRECLAHVRASKSLKPGAVIHLAAGEVLEMMERQGELFRLRYPAGNLLALLVQQGHMPLPPYIDRADEAVDRERYQTVYNQVPGAVAAPTAGLHFDQALLAQLETAGVETAYVTLHVGAGTFQPVRAEHIADHRMHSEWFSVSEAVCQRVQATRARGGRVIAVGTTSVRCLESAAGSGSLQASEGETDIFITPGYRFRVVDGLITNFHLPESTLLMLVSAFAGKENVFNAYAEAIKEKYRFFSYGDGMFIFPHRFSP